VQQSCPVCRFHTVNAAFNGHAINTTFNGHITFSRAAHSGHTFVDTAFGGYAILCSGLLFKLNVSAFKYGSRKRCSRNGVGR
jgi:hypothetical protein